ncbi:hypothetical protein DFH09DRAFT_1427702 [Mycena vulgaris]|nr:hypothetical protein DFH09DRAFT_1427702 [Mycena vulgaris]
MDYETLAWDHRVYRYIFLSGLVILLYDYLLSVGAEVAMIWSSPMRLSKCSFLAIRYIPLACSATIIPFYFGDLTAVPVHIYAQSYSTPLVGFAFWQRILAMYGFNLWVFLAVGGPAAVSSGLGLWTIITYGHPQMATGPGLTGCHTIIPRRTAIRLAATWTAQLAGYTVVFCLTLYRAHADRAVMSTISGSIIGRLARDGAMHFGIIVLATVGDVSTLIVGDRILAGMMAWWSVSYALFSVLRATL